jgi:Rps23 Pro-64 3,4-dihydroxylase Tpa1-like proline 4-hydroxylase
VSKTEIDYSRFKSEEFKKAKPFPHFVLDDFLQKDFVSVLEERYPSLDDVSWWQYHNHFEKKLACNNINILDSCFTDFFNLVNSRKFVLELEKLTGIEGLIADPSLHGGGLHRIERGGKLDIHADFNYHKITGWRRRLNLIVYLNKGWKEEYKGHTEFWDKPMIKCVTRVLPVFNRMCIFAVDDDTWHGHPDPLECPVGHSRKSLAVYYYSLHKVSPDVIQYHSTDYKKRPTDKTDDLIEALRADRRKGRLENRTT